MINYLLPSRAATVQTLGHPAAGIIGWTDSTTNNTGIAVSQNTALTFAAVWCATRVIAETIATLPCMLYRRNGDDSRERAADDPRYWLMTEQPHPAMSACSFFETQTAAMVLHGNCFAKIANNTAGEVTQLEPRQPDVVNVELDGDEPYYEIADPREVLTAEQMLHVAGLGGDGISGWSVVKYAAQSIGGGIAADMYAGGQWGNGATPKGVLKHPMRLDKSAREMIRREWEDVHGGSANAGKVAIMHGGMEFQPISMSNEDAQFLESRQFSIREIARWFRLPPHMLADLADSSVRANIEQQAIEFIVYSLKPWLVRWQQTLNRKLLLPDERRSLYFEFLLESLLQGDSAAQATAWSVGRQWGWYSVNEIRRQMNLPPVDGGDVYLQPSNMIPADSEMAQGNMPEPPQQIVAPEKPADDDEVPESAGVELRGNLAASVAAIVRSAQELRQELEADSAVLSQAMLAAESRTAATLKDLRAVRDDIRRDIGAPRLEQVRGCDVGLVNAAHDLLHENMRCVLKKERAEVLKAARSATSRGRNFVHWLDEFYPRHGEQLATRIDGAARAYQKLRPEIGESLASTVAATHCLRHKQELLAAADGDAAGFVERVQAATATWGDEIQQIRLGD